MNGVESSNQKSMRSRQSRTESGQVLLLLIMVMGTLLIVAMTAIFQGTTDTQISGINQTSQRTLSAAEAGLESALLNGEEGTFAELGLTSLSGIDLAGSAVRIEEKREDLFTIPKLDPDSQYTFYLSEYNYNPTTGAVSFGFPYGGKMAVYYTSDNDQRDCTDVALEFMIVYDTNTSDGIYQVKTLIADAGNAIDPSLTNPANVTDDDIFFEAVPAGNNDLGEPYQCYTHDLDMADYPNARIMIIKSYLSSTKIGLTTRKFQPSDSGLPAFTPQGKTITSTARSSGFGPTPTPGGPEVQTDTGVIRTATIFQSYPQIPAEMFVTSF